MTKVSQPAKHRRRGAMFFFAWLLLPCPAIAVAAAVDEAAAALHARYDALRDALAQSPFQRPLHLDSMQTARELKGEVYAVVEHPFERVSAAIGGAAHWCGILMLHLNVKGCTVTPGHGVTAFLGGKHDEPLHTAYPLELVHNVAAASSAYVEVALNAAKGPFGTRDYRIVLEAAPIAPRATFVHLSYSYGYGPAAMTAMRMYLNTIGRAKVGFTIVGRLSNGEPVRVGDVRGALERNTMRYFLALDAYLGAASVPPQDRLDKRLRDWFEACERYPLQLRELKEDEYLAMKRREFREARMQDVEANDASPEGEPTVH